MKYLNPLFIFFMSVCLLSCHKSQELDEIDNSALGYLAGTWNVHLTAVDAEGNEVLTDDWFYQLGLVQIRTFSVGKNITDSLWLEDVNGAIWNFKVKVACNIQTGEFCVTDAPNALSSTTPETDFSTTITNGKIIRTSEYSEYSDFITLDILFSNDTEASLYYDRMRLSGHRSK